MITASLVHHSNSLYSISTTRSRIAVQCTDPLDIPPTWLIQWVVPFTKKWRIVIGSGARTKYCWPLRKRGWSWRLQLKIQLNTTRVNHYGSCFQTFVAKSLNVTIRQQRYKRMQIPLLQKWSRQKSSGRRQHSLLMRQITQDRNELPMPNQLIVANTPKF